jgi:predicted XRE-type DNA-binding protein
MASGPSPKHWNRASQTKEHVQFEESSGNVFADLAIPNPSLALVKAKLVHHIRNLISERKLTQTQAAGLLGLAQPKISALVRGQVQGYSIDRLFRFLNALGQHVDISIRPAKKGKSKADATTLTVS